MDGVSIPMFKSIEGDFGILSKLMADKTIGDININGSTIYINKGPILVPFYDNNHNQITFDSAKSQRKAIKELLLYSGVPLNFVERIQTSICKEFRITLANNSEPPTDENSYLDCTIRKFGIITIKP